MDCSKLLYEQIVEDITERIRSGALAIGDRIEPVQQLRREYEVSHITILRALRELSGGGVIRKSGGRYQVAGPAPLRETATLGARNSTLGVFVRPFRESGPDDYFNEINLALEREIAMARMNYLRCHYACVFNFSSPDEAGEYERSGEMLSQMLAIAERVCGVLVDERVPERVLKSFLAQSPVPAVLVNRASASGVCSVTLPNRGSVELILEQAMRQGYRDVLFCGGADSRYSNDYARYQALRELTELPQYRELTVYWHTGVNRPLAHYAAELKNVLAEVRKPLLMASSDAFAAELIAQLETAEFRAGREFGVCGFYAHRQQLPDGRRLASVKVNTRAIGEQAVKLLLKQIQYPWNSGKEEIQVPVEFIYGDTL